MREWNVFFVQTPLSWLDGLTGIQWRCTAPIHGVASSSQLLGKLTGTIGAVIFLPPPPVFSTAGDINRKTEMGGVRVERTQYRRWGGN